MSAPKARKSLSFQENDFKFLKLRSIGYNNYSDSAICDFFGVNRSHALYFLRSGSGSVYIRNRSYDVKSGDMFFIHPNEPWNIHFKDDVEWEYYWMAFSEDYAHEISDMLGFTNGCPVRAARLRTRVEWIFDSLLEAKAATPEVYFTSLSSLMQILASEFSHSGVSDSTSHHRELCENAKQIIDINFKNPDFSVAHVAEMLFLSHGQMSRVFKDVIGISPVAYLADKRLSHAAELCSSGNLSVKELCAASGFSDIGHFMKRFKKKFGMTVVQYKKTHDLSNM